MANLNLILKPAQTELIIRPGITVTQAYSVTNSGDSPVMLSTEVLPWIPVGSDGSLTYQNVLQNPYFEFNLANSDLKLGQTFILRSGESRQLVLKAKTNPASPPSDGYFTFFITQDLTNTLHSDESLSSATAKVGSHLLLSTSDIEFPASLASVTRFTTSPQFKDILFPQIRLEANITNSSTYFTKTVGKLTVTKNNLVIKEFDLFPHNVLAGSSRSVSCNLGNLPVPCTLNPPFWPGAYTATLTLDPSLSAPATSTTFYVFPYTFLSIVIFFGLLSLLVWKRLRH